MSLAKEIAYHVAREKACRDNAARALDDDTAARHEALAAMHAERRHMLEQTALDDQAGDPAIYSTATSSFERQSTSSA